MAFAFCVLSSTASSSGEIDQQGPLLGPLHSTTLLPTDSQTPLSVFGNSIVVSLRPTVFTSPVAGQRLKDATSDYAVVRSKGLNASSSWFDGKLKADTEVAFLDGRQPSWGAQPDSDWRMWRMSVNGIEGALHYGVSSRSAGKAYSENPDQSLREVWAEYPLGPARLRSAVGQTWNNVSGEPTVPRFSQTYGNIAFTLARPQWPQLTLTYTRASVLNALAVGGTPSYNATTNTVAAMLAHTKSLWQVQLASSYQLSDNQLSGAKSTTSLIESLMASYHPWNTFIVTSSLGYRASVDQWSSVHIKTPSGSLSVNYRANRHCFISAFGGYSVTRSDDGIINQESVNSRALLAWTLPAISYTVSPPIVAVEANYTVTADHAMASAELQDISGLVRLVVEEF
jgi:hypothetical protein